MNIGLRLDDLYFFSFFENDPLRFSYILYIYIYIWEWESGNRIDPFYFNLNFIPRKLNITCSFDSGGFSRMNIHVK